VLGLCPHAAADHKSRLMGKDAQALMTLIITIRCMAEHGDTECWHAWPIAASTSWYDDPIPSVAYIQKVWFMAPLESLTIETRPPLHVFQRGHKTQLLHHRYSTFDPSHAEVHIDAWVAAETAR
jgi:hypothetical protein